MDCRIHCPAQRVYRSLNVLQAELLHRSRAQEARGDEPDARVEQALMVTIAGVAAGMRNTG